jgi:hypothetical protein
MKVGEFNLKYRAFLCAICLSTILAQAQQKRYVVIDQDAMGPAGTDMNSMLVFLQSPSVEVLGITVVTGDGWRNEEVAHFAPPGNGGANRYSSGSWSRRSNDSHEAVDQHLGADVWQGSLSRGMDDAALRAWFGRNTEAPGRESDNETGDRRCRPFPDPNGS